MRDKGHRWYLILLSLALCLIGLPANVWSQGVTLGGGVSVGPGVSLGVGGVGAATWSDGPRRATLAVGVVVKDQFGKDRFTTGGAAVLVQDSRGRIFIATALHVFDNPGEHWAPESLRIRGWKDEHKSRYEDLGSVLQLRKDGHPLFTASTRLDLAVILAPQEIQQRVADDKHVVIAGGPEVFGDVNDTCDGADVFILGFPALVGDQYQQRALMRSGVIAWTDSSSPVDYEFLVDARIFPGNSGGPVFSSAAGMTRDAGLATGRQIKLLGLVSQTINAKPELALGIRLPSDAMVLGAAGVGVIEPAHGLVEVMAQVP